MGYYTSFELTVEGVNGIDSKDIIHGFREECESAKSAIDEDGDSYADLKWYKHTEDLTEFSKKFPEALFILSGEGETSDDVWRGYFKNGKRCRLRPEVIWPVFNEGMLEERGGNKMKKLEFEGHGDDTFGEYGYTKIDHDNCADGSPIIFKVSSGPSTIYVIGRYDDDLDLGHWGIEYRVDEKQDPPGWPAYFMKSECVYSPRLAIEAPDDVTVKCLSGEQDG